MRSAIGVVVGAIVANVIFFLGGMVAERVYPTPPELLDPQTPEATALRVEMAEGGGLLLVIVGSALGGFIGGATGTKVGGGRGTVVAIVTGVLLAPLGHLRVLCFLSAATLVSCWLANWFPGFLLCWRPCSPQYLRLDHPKDAREAVT